jgi:hypothetical protein
MTTPLPGSFSPTAAAEITFLPLADPERRENDPIRALQAAHDLRILLGLAELAAVRHARQAGWTWSEIGEALGITRQAAQQRFGVLLDEEDQADDDLPGCAHALDARNCSEPGGGCPDARDVLSRA